MRSGRDDTHVCSAISDEEDEFKIEEEEKEEDEEENVLEKEPEINYDDVPPLEKEGEAVAASSSRMGLNGPLVNIHFAPPHSASTSFT